MKKIVLLAHGFMIHDSHDLTWFYNYVSQSEEFKNYEFQLIKLYNRKIGKTSRPKTMEKHLSDIVKSYLKKDYDVTLVGYSFSCPLIAKVARDLKLKGVIHIAPAIKLIKTNLLTMHIKNALKTLKLKIKHGNKKAKKIMDRTKTSGIVVLSFHIALTMLKYRKYFKSKTPIVILRGKEDTYSRQDDIVWILKKSQAIYVKNIAINEEGYNHFFIRRENLVPLYPSIELKLFLERVMNDE